MVSDIRGRNTEVRKVDKALIVTSDFRSDHEEGIMASAMVARVQMIFVALLVTCAIVAALLWKRSASNNLASSPAEDKKADSDSFINRLNDERIVAIHRWDVENDEEKTLLCVFQAFDKNPHYEGSGIKLSILEPSGALIYEAYFTELQRVYSIPALRDLSDQLIIEISYGGSTSFLQMLDYRNGKVIELVDGKESDFEVGAEVRPQFRSSISPANEPFQIMLTHGVGLASPARKQTSVYRYKDGKYRFVGSFLQQELDDYIEELLKSAKGRSKSGK